MYSPRQILEAVYSARSVQAISRIWIGTAGSEFIAISPVNEDDRLFAQHADAGVPHKAVHFRGGEVAQVDLLDAAGRQLVTESYSPVGGGVYAVAVCFVGDRQRFLRSAGALEPVRKQATRDEVRDAYAAELAALERYATRSRRVEAR
jgi:hypothetical protein